MPANDEDRKAALDALTHRVESDELVAFDMRDVAQLVWDEDAAPGRPEMTGQWHVAYRDGTSDVIDLPQANVEGAIKEARGFIATKLCGD